MYPSFVYTSNKRIRCFFFTVVVKNKSLVKYYQESLKGYMEKYYPLCNQDISVRVYMNAGDCYDLMDDLIENGLKKVEDFVCFDTDYLVELKYRYPDKFTWRKNLDLGLDWLKGRCIDGYVYVWLTDENKCEAVCLEDF